MEAELLAVPILLKQVGPSGRALELPENKTNLHSSNLMEDMPEMEGSGTAAARAGEIAEENDEASPNKLPPAAPLLFVLLPLLLSSPSSLAVVTGRGLMPEI